MPVDGNIVQGSYLKDLLDQPEALEDTCTGLAENPSITQLAARLAQREFARVVLTGMGSSYHALHPLNLQLITHGVPSALLETSELVHSMRNLLEPGTLVVAVSQSGESAEIIRLLDVTPARSFLIAVTNSEHSSLAAKAHATVLINAGAESGVACKTFVSSLVGLEWLGALLCGRDLDNIRCELRQAAPAASAYLRDWKCHVTDWCGLLAGVRAIFITGRGSSLAAAGSGALITKEAAHFPAEAMSSASFRHGPFEMVGDQTFVVVYSGDPASADRNQRLVEDIIAAGGRAGLAGSNSKHKVLRLPAVPQSVRPIVEILPIQMMSLALATLAGREPGKFQFVSKVTTVE
ncbi:MAG TPA: SIS domain-containing protein [Bryobacteraceae bacterium]|nr:SIS domain-containing protein [Bryobacteraceae bacterium]